MADGSDQEAPNRLGRARTWTVVAGAILIALAAWIVGNAIWWGISVDWDLSVRVDTPQLTDPSLPVLLFGGLAAGLALAAAGVWTILNALAPRRRG